MVISDPKTILILLEERYPDAKSELTHRNAFELIVATILSAQCTDERVNQVTPVLFKHYPTSEKLAVADPEKVKEIIRSTGFFNNKTKSIITMSQKVITDYGGKIPDTMKDLVTLPGVARKTANVVLYNAFGKNEGVAVDTHVKRISFLLGLTKHTNPDKVETDLMSKFPQESWGFLSQSLVLYGRYRCKARSHDQSQCFLGH